MLNGVDRPTRFPCTPPQLRKNQSASTFQELRIYRPLKLSMSKEICSKFFLVSILQSGNRVTGTIGAFSQELDSLTVSQRTIVIGYWYPRCCLGFTQWCNLACWKQNDVNVSFDIWYFLSTMWLTELLISIPLMEYTNAVSFQKLHLFTNIFSCRTRKFGFIKLESSPWKDNYIWLTFRALALCSDESSAILVQLTSFSTWTPSL